MKKKYLVELACGVLMLGMAGLAEATPMVATYNAQFTGLSNTSGSLYTGLVSGAYYTWTFLYDNEGTEGHIFDSNGNIKLTHGVPQNGLFMSDALLLDGIFLGDLNNEVSEVPYSALRESYSLYYQTTTNGPPHDTHVQVGRWSNMISVNDYPSIFNYDDQIYLQYCWLRGDTMGIDKAYFSNLNVSVGNYNPVPEPATMLLMGTGLVGLIGARRKMKK